MESNRKRRGFMKGKMVMQFCKAAKPSSTMQYTSKFKPSQSSPSTATMGFLVKQEYVIPQPKQKVSFIVAADSGRDSIPQFDYPFGVAVDESVDMKAANYISCVQERFKLERINFE